MADLILPTSVELGVVAQDKIPNLTRDRLGFTLFPMRDKDAALVAWEQRDNYLGLMAVRGINGAPTRVKRVGGKRYQMEPGVYGDFIDLDEYELKERRKWGTFGTPIDLSDLVMEAQDQLLGRYLDRVEAVVWSLVTSGTFSVTGPTGAVLHTDSYTLQTFTASVPWSNVGAAAPFADMRTVQLKSHGHSVNFGAGAVAVMNRKTSNLLLSNQNPGDVAGRRTGGFGTFNTIAEINTLSGGDDLPPFRIYDEGYQDDTNTFVNFIPDNKIVVVGARPAGQTVGEVIFTRNVNNPGMAPGMYQKVIDRGEDAVPRSIEVHIGADFGPAIYYPSAVVVMSV